jgi:hypothetical protein
MLAVIGRPPTVPSVGGSHMLLTKGRTMSEKWTADSVPPEAYDRVSDQLKRAEKLLREIRDGKHSLPGALVQIDRYFEQRGQADKDFVRSLIPGEPFSDALPGEQQP